MAPNTRSKKFRAVVPTEKLDYVSISNATYNLSHLPEEILRIIFALLNYDTIANIRLVCRKFNAICQSILTLEFKKLQNEVNKRYELIILMPRQVPLPIKRQIIVYLSEEVHKLNRLIGKHLNTGCCCFFAGKILDEIINVLNIADTYYDKLDMPNFEELPLPFQILNRYFKLYRQFFNFLKSSNHFFSDMKHLV